MLDNYRTKINATLSLIITGVKDSNGRKLENEMYGNTIININVRALVWYLYRGGGDFPSTLIYLLPLKNKQKLQNNFAILLVSLLWLK